MWHIKTNKLKVVPLHTSATVDQAVVVEFNEIS
jgi:hypothetical protein